MAYQNFYATKLQNTIGAADTVIAVQTIPTVTAGRLVLEPRNAAQREIISFTGVAGSTLTGVVRGLYGTTAKTHSSGSLVEMNFLAQDYTDLVNAFNSFAATNSSGWYDSLATIASIVYNGNRSYTVTTNTDQSALWSPGTRLRFTRTVSSPLQNTSLNGTNQYYNRTATINGMTFTDDFAVGVWIKATANANGVIMSRLNGTSGWRFNLEPSGQITFAGFNGGAGNFSFIQSYQSIPLNRWVHVTAQLDMSAYTLSPTTSYIMFDGADVPSLLGRSGTNPTSIIQAGNLEVGSQNGGLNPFPGKIAQAYVTSAKVTQANARSLMTQGITPALITANSIVSAYSFSNSIVDLNTTNANNLTANGSAVATDNDAPWGQQSNGSLSATVDYGIVTAISGTSVTVQVAEGNTLPTSGGITSLQYATTKAPYGMPVGSSRWAIQTITRQQDYVSLTNTSNYWRTNHGINAPVGDWVASTGGEIGINHSSAVPDMRFYLMANSATSTPTITSNPDLMGRTVQNAATTYMELTVFASGRITVTTPTQYSLYMYSGVAPATGGIRGVTGYTTTLENALL